MKKFNTIFNETVEKYSLNEIPFSLPKRKIYSFLNTIKNLITEDYKIFPVPKLLLDDMTNFCMVEKSGAKKKYLCEDIKNSFIDNWTYYQQFLDNINLMLDDDKECSITLSIINNLNDLIENLKKYNPGEDLTIKTVEDFLNEEFKGFAYTYDEKFNINILINIKNAGEFQIRKIIQHELIHWMQVSLNSHIGKTYGKFKNLKFSLSDEDKKFLIECEYSNIENLISYVFSENEFEAWAANAVEDFECLKILTIEKFKQIIEDKDLFKIWISKHENSNLGELLMFGELCYLSSKNNKNDDLYWYLINAIKENKEVKHE